MEMNPPKALWEAPTNGIGTGEGDAVWVSDGTADSTKGLKPGPLNTCRLKPFRQVTKSVILSILETGHVSLEFLKCKDGVERVTKLFLVSGDGQEIYVEKWRSSCPVFIHDKCHETQKTSTWQNFSYVTLPYKYWKRYAHAYRFVELVKSKTGKVTIYSDRAKCVLMENSPPNFEANFYNGPKITMMHRKVHIQEDNGVALIFSQDSVSSMVNVYTLDLIHHAIQMKEHCELLEASIAAVEQSSEVGEPLFPVTLGRRPWTSFCSSTSSTSEKLEAVSSSNSSTHLFHPLPSIPSDLYDGQTSPSPIQELIPSGDHVRVTSVQQPPHTTDRAQSSLISGGLDTPVRRISTLEGRKLRCQLFLHKDSNQADGNMCSSLPMEIEKTQNHAAMSDILQCTGKEENASLVQESDTVQVKNCSLAKLQLNEDTFNNSSLDLSGIIASSEASHLHCLHSNVTSTPTKSYEAPSLLTVAEVCNPCVTAADTIDNTLQCTWMLASDLQSFKNAPSTSRKDFSSTANVLSPGAGTSCSPVLVPVFTALRQASDGLDDLSHVVRQAFVPYTGWATQLASGAVWIHYNDGTQLAVLNSQAKLIYVDHQGQIHRYQQVDGVPDVVKDKLEKLTVVLEYLMACPAVLPYRVISP